MKALVRREKEARARVLEDATRHAEVSEDALRAWIEARGEYADALGRLSAESAGKALAAELAAIESEMARLEESGRIPRDEAFRTAVDLGERLRWVLWMTDIVGEELTMDPLALVEEEIGKIEILARNLVRLDARLGAQSEEVTAQTRRARYALVLCRLDRFVGETTTTRGAGPLDEATGRWIAATEAFQIERDILRELEDLGSAERPELDRLEDLRARREAHLEACARSLASCGPGEATEFFHSSLGDLLEQVSSVLSEGESVPRPARLEILGLAVSRIDAFLRALGEWAARLSQKGVLPPEARARFRLGMRQLARARRQLLAARIESRVQMKLREVFGARNVRRFDSLIMILIFALVGLVVCEWRINAGLPGLAGTFGDQPASRLYWGAVFSGAVKWFHVADLAFCLIFQIDFFVRWAFSRWARSYFLQHFFLESLPALPYGLVLGSAQMVTILRLLRVRAALALRAIILVGVRLFRVVVFFMRGVDRAVEKFRSAIDRDVVLFDADPLGEAPESPLRRRALSLESRRQRFLQSFYRAVPWGGRGDLLMRHALQLGAETRVSAGLALPYRRAVGHRRVDIRIERVIYNFLDCDVTRAVAMMGREGVERVARWLRFLDLPGFRQAPVVRRLIPAARRLNPAEAVSSAVNALGQVLQEMLGVLRFWADLSGITTGPQILDRIGTTMIIASRRPAMRLILLGALFLLAEGLANLFGRGGVLSTLVEKTSSLLATPILLLGSVCLIVLLVGRWFRRISGEALDQYLRTSDAHFYPLVKARKYLRFDDDIRLLHRSVLRPECRLRCDEEIDESEWTDFLAEPMRERARFMPGRSAIPPPPFEEFAEDRELVVLLYRDFLDGPVLHRTDDKASVQLLGNLSIQNIRIQTLGADSKELRRLERLSLDKGSILSLGPYMWFRFITESLAVETAKLITEYNSCCIPKDQVHLASKEGVERFETFLAEHRAGGDKGLARLSGSREERCGEALSNASFTAFDFLGPTEESDEAVRQRFGDEVFEALRNDRRAVIRDVFGTRPYHLLPRHKRAVNPYRLYKKYLGGAKFFFLPFVFLGALVRLNLAGVSQIRELIREVLGKKRTRRSHYSRQAGFDVAVRKINRMRKPLFMEAVRLRAAVDVEYLGLRIPGSRRDEETVTYEEHLDFIGALDTERRPIAKLRSRAIRDLRRFRVFLDAHGWLNEGFDELLSQLDATGRMLAHRGEVMRALVTAYVTDHGSLRSILTAPEWARNFFEKVLRTERKTLVELVGEFISSGTFVFLPRHRRRRRMFREFLRLEPSLRGLQPRVRRAVLARFLGADRDAERMLEFALRNLRHEAEVGEDALLEALKRAACDYKLWTRKLMTVRTVQTLTVLDVRNYRDLVWEVGGYTKERVPVGA